MAAPTIQLKRGSNAVPNALAGEPIIRYNGSITELHIGDSGGTTSELIASDAAYDANIEILTKSVASASVGSLTLKDSQAAQGTLTVQPNATTTDYTFVFPAAAGSQDDVLTVSSVAAGVVTMDFAAPSASSFTLAADAGTNDTFNTGETLTFTGGTGISSTVTNNQISYDLDTELQALSSVTSAADALPYFTGSGTASVTTLSAFGRSLIDDADAATARTTLGVDAAGTDNSTDVTLVTTTADYLSITGQAITLNQIDLTTDVTGALPLANGGTNATTAADARTNLGLAIGSDVQAYDAQLADIAGLTPSDGGFIVGDGTNFVIESGATARTSLGVDAAGTDNSTDVTLVTTAASYLSISGQEITLADINLASEVTGTLPIANGGTGATTAAGAATALGVGTTDSPSFAGATAGNIQVGITGDNEIDTSSGNLTIDSAGGTTTIDDNLIVSGDLTVSGTTTTVNTQTVTVEDRLFELGVVNGAAPSAETTWDLGVAFNYHDGTGAKRSALIWVDDTEGFSLVNELGTITNEAGTNAADPQIAITEFANLAVNSLFIGDLGTAANQVIDSSKNVINVTIDGGTY
jgi:hypothetical protein